MYRDQLPKRNIIQYLGVGVFVVGIVWGTLLAIDWVGKQVAPPVTVSEEAIPDFLQLKSKPQDVLYAEAYLNSDGKEELRYAYAAGAVESADGEAVERRTPNSRTKVLSVEEKGNERIETLSTSFYSTPQFYEDNGQWRQIEYATTTPEVFSASGAVRYVQRREWWERLLPGEPLFAQTSTFRPDPNVETSSVDGWVSINNIENTGLYQTCQTAAGEASGSSFTDSATTLLTQLSQSVNDNPPLLDNLGEDFSTCDITRTFLLFNTASLPDTAVISSASVRLYVTTKSSTLGDNVVLVSSNPASNTALTTNDVADVGSTVFSSFVIDNLVTGSYNTFSLNSSGIGNISLTSVTKKALRIESELNGTFSFILDGSLLDQVIASSADASGTSQDPELQVTYIASAFSFGQWFPF